MQVFRYVRHQQNKEELIDFLCRRFPYHPRFKWIEQVTSGALTVNTANAKPAQILETGDQIEYRRERALEPAIDRRYKMVYEDEFLLVVEKNGNIPIVESGRFYQNTLINVLKEEEGYSELFAVHRLDKETSGLVLVAKSAEMAKAMGFQFAKGETKKIYQAVLIGQLEQEVLVDQPIGKVKPAGPETVRIRQLIEAGGKASQSIFRPLAKAGGLTLVEVELLTGRTHQIRCHAEWLGMPILGDKLYGQSDERFLRIYQGEEEPIFGEFGLIDRQLLHAGKLGFFHPSSGDWREFDADFTPHFAPYPACAPLLEAWAGKLVKGA